MTLGSRETWRCRCLTSVTVLSTEPRWAVTPAQNGGVVSGVRQTRSTVHTRAGCLSTHRTPARKERSWHICTISSTTCSL